MQIPADLRRNVKVLDLKLVFCSRLLLLLSLSPIPPLLLQSSTYPFEVQSSKGKLQNSKISNHGASVLEFGTFECHFVFPPSSSRPPLALLFSSYLLLSPLLTPFLAPIRNTKFKTTKVEINTISNSGASAPELVMLELVILFYTPSPLPAPNHPHTHSRTHVTGLVRT